MCGGGKRKEWRDLYALSTLPFSSKVLDLSSGEAAGTSTAGSGEAGPSAAPVSQPGPTAGRTRQSKPKQRRVQMGKKVSGIVELMVASISALLVRQFDFVKESPAASWFCDDDGNPKYTALEWDRAYGYPDVLIPSVLDRVIMVVCGDPDEPASTKPGDPNRAEVFGALGRAALELAEARKKEQEAGTARYAWYHATAEDFQGTGELARQLFSHVDGARIFNTSVPAGTDPATGEPRHRNGTFVSIPEIDSQGPRQRRAALI